MTPTPKMRECRCRDCETTRQTHEVVPREAVQWFTQHMELELLANDHKSGWCNDSLSSLAERIEDELAELKGAIEDGVDVATIVSEAADVANFAMMVAHNAAAKP